MLEREVVVRSFKHIFNKHVRENLSEEQTAQMVSHLLNCLLAPREFIKRMDDEKIAPSRAGFETINAPEGEPVAEVAAAAHEEPERPAMSKKEKKRQK